MTTKKQTGPWDLEEIPYETNDKAGGWYLHFDPTGERTDDVLYISKAHCTEADAHLIAVAPEMLEALKALSLHHRNGWGACMICGSRLKTHVGVCPIPQAETVIRKIRGK